MGMKEVAHVAAVLGVGMAEPHIAECAKLASALYEADLTLLRLAHEEDASGIDHTDEIKRVFEDAGRLLEAFPKAGLNLYFNDELPVDPLDGDPVGGRLRIEWEGSKWDADNPLYLALPDEALGTKAQPTKKPGMGM